MRRRQFITLIGGAAAWPFPARAQSALPIVGFVNAYSSRDYALPLSAFLKGLGEIGFVEGQSVAIEYRWAEDHNERLPALVSDLIRHQPAVIAATSTPAALAVKSATTTIPIVFETGADPVAIGLVPSLNRPEGNVTGVTQMSQEVGPKLLELLHEVIPTAAVVALLVNPDNPVLAQADREAMGGAARNLGLELQVLNASSERDFDDVFKKLTEMRAAALVIGSEGLFTSHSEQLAALALRTRLPAFYKGREFAAAGGLVSYGSEIADSYRIAGIYTGRILKGEKPADLPVQQAIKIQLIINFKTAKALGITIPLPVSGRADEVIE